MASTDRLNDISWIRLLIPQERRIILSGLMQLLHGTSGRLDAEHDLMARISIEELMDSHAGHGRIGLAAKLPQEAARIVWAALLSFVGETRAVEIGLGGADMARAQHLFETLCAGEKQAAIIPVPPAPVPAPVPASAPSAAR